MKKELLATILDDADLMERQELEDLAAQVEVIIEAFEDVGAIDPSEREFARRIGYLC